MFGFGHGPELIILLVIALIVLGPGKIPEVAQMLGKGIRELRQASADLQKTFDVNELMNPAPAPPPPTPPVEASPTTMAAATETILPPAKPKRARKPSTPRAEIIPAVAAIPEGNGSSPAAKPRRRRPLTASASVAEAVVAPEASDDAAMAGHVTDAAAAPHAGDAAVTPVTDAATGGGASAESELAGAGGNGSALAKPARRRASKKTSEPVSLDAPA
jgi:TatA/E family protein of Tat protein translocase